MAEYETVWSAHIQGEAHCGEFLRSKMLFLSTQEVGLSAMFEQRPPMNYSRRSAERLVTKLCQSVGVDGARDVGCAETLEKPARISGSYNH